MRDVYAAKIWVKTIFQLIEYSLKKKNTFLGPGYDVAGKTVECSASILFGLMQYWTASDPAP